MYTLGLVGTAVGIWTEGAEVVELGSKFTARSSCPRTVRPEVVVGGTVKAVEDGLVTLALTVTCDGRRSSACPGPSSVPELPCRSC
jgi:hypothetical protein